jgi:hypothetical protein
MLKFIKVHTHEMGLYFHDGEFRGLLTAGRHRFFDPLGRVRVDVVSQRTPWLVHDKLDVIVKSGALDGRAVVVDLKDYQRGLVWIDGRFSHVLPPGLYAYWNTLRDVQVEVIDARAVRLVHNQQGRPGVDLVTHGYRHVVDIGHHLGGHQLGHVLTPLAV